MNYLKRALETLVKKLGGEVVWDVEQAEEQVAVVHYDNYRVNPSYREMAQLRKEYPKQTVVLFLYGDTADQFVV